MILSMTGYASRIFQTDNRAIQMEIRSVNHRFLDLTIKLPEELRHMETIIRNILTSHITRGKVDVKVFIKENIRLAAEIGLNRPLLEEYLKTAEEVQKLTSKTIGMNMHDILSFPGMLNQESGLTEQQKLDFISELNKLIIDFRESQASEGNNIELILSERTSAINQVIESLKPLVEASRNEYKIKLTERLSEFLKESDINDTRLQQEFAFFCQKIDVSEEIDRLWSHTTELASLLTKGGSIGKRLDFICQEMNREANTFGAKSISIATSNCAVELKVLIEQIREQVQNIM